MKQIKSAREILAWIERNFFKGAGLAKACKLEGEERRAFVLVQVDRLLADKRGLSEMALVLSDQFWSAEEGRVPMEWSNPVIPGRDYRTNPLLSPEEQQTLTEREKSRLRLILDVAGLCHDLGLHYTFNLKEAFGVKNDWWVSNKQLVEWLTTTAYEWIAMHMAYILRKRAIGVYFRSYYQPAQDEIAELYSSEYHELIREPDSTDIPPRGYVKTIIDELQRIDRHWRRGRRLKLNPELIILHDEIYGFVPRQFDKGVLAAARVLYDYMNKELCGRLMLTGYDHNATSWSDQPESVRSFVAEVLNRFADKVREVRAEYFAKGWLTDDSLSFGYLMAHAERCAYGDWRGEDDVL
jgi:hypothetical protein